jgi:hypothetical protein
LHRHFLAPFFLFHQRTPVELQEKNNANTDKTKTTSPPMIHSGTDGNSTTFDRRRSAAFLAEADGGTRCCNRARINAQHKCSHNMKEPQLDAQ